MSDSSGAWSLSNVPNNAYILIAMGDNWGGYVSVSSGATRIASIDDVFDVSSFNISSANTYVQLWKCTSSTVSGSANVAMIAIEFVLTS